MPFSEFKDLQAEWFLRRTNHQDLQEYCEGLEKALKEAYGGDASSIAMLEALDPILSSRMKDRFAAQYSFRTDGPNGGRKWKVKIKLSEIPHISAGTTDYESEGNRIPLEFARLLVERGLADVVDHAPLVKRRRKFGLFGLSFNSAFPDVTLVGTMAGIYMSVKIGSIRALNMKMNWQACVDGKPPFLELRESIEEALGECKADSIVTVLYEPNELAPLLTQCDEVLQARASSGDLASLFAAVGVTLEDWLGARPR